MPKEKGYNPVQEQRKADKAKAIKTGTQPTILFDYYGAVLTNFF
jgi:hypothetical protein